MNRRTFLQSTTASGAGLLILRGGAVSGADAPSKKLNVGLIGVQGRGTAHHKAISSENIVALCDINEAFLAKTAKKWPKAKKFFDWRKMLDDKSLKLDAIICATPDHVHAHICTWSMNRGLHIYCEKPIANSVEEARVVRAAYLKQQGKIATQCGTQRHAYPNFNRVRELVLDGAIGDLKSAYAWGNRQLRKPGYLPAKGQPPKDLHYDLWIGPSPMHPYNPGYFDYAAKGANCLNWNMYWDFGSGQIGDMGSHTMDLAWNALDADLPTSAEGEGDTFNPDVTPVELHTAFDIPANNWRDAIRLHWYQGGAMPKSPKSYVDLNKIGHGAMFKGTNGYLVADFTSRLLLPFGDASDLTYYKPRKKDGTLPDLGHFQKEWVDACKGDLKTSCDFDYSGKLIETMLLGLVAYRTGKKIKYDGKAGRVTDNPEADALLKRKYRDGWPLDA